jgi:hypothetical protein
LPKSPELPKTAGISISVPSFLAITNFGNSGNLHSMDPAEQLQKLYLAGFELQTFDRFPKAIGVLRDDCVAFLVPGQDGLQILGNAGWRMGESLGPLVERGGKKVFVHKSEVLDATPERIAVFERFKSDLRNVLHDEDGAPA